VSHIKLNTTKGAMEAEGRRWSFQLGQSNFHRLHQGVLRVQEGDAQGLGR
jgi:hypothetical protein